MLWKERPGTPAQQRNDLPVDLVHAWVMMPSDATIAP